MPGTLSRVMPQLYERLAKAQLLEIEGVISRSVGLTLEAKGISAPIGAICHIRSKNNPIIEAMVTGFADQRLFLMPLHPIDGLEVGAKVVPTSQVMSAPVGDKLLGRIIDGAGKPLDGRGALQASGYCSLKGKLCNPLQRQAITQMLDVGIKSINALLTVGRGQRLGLMAGSGVGKSVLLGMLARFTAVDVIVVGLIGERGREVQEFIEHNLGEGLKRSVVVASPADYSPVLRLQGAYMAMTIAEYFRDQGKQVLLLMDSLTRFSQAQREIALAMGEPPATKGYPPSSFSILPQLIERAGNGCQDQGSITAIFTVLAEGDDIQDPVVDASRAILDGHIVLSRHLAEMGHYPAIDIEASISRVMSQVVDSDHRALAINFKKYYALYQENRDLVNMGAYAPGSNADVDAALQRFPQMNRFLQQDMFETKPWNESRALFVQALGENRALAER